MKWLRTLLGLALSLVLLWLLLRGVNTDELLASLRSANYVAVIPAVLIYFAGVGVRAVRWRLFLAPVARYSTPQLFVATIIGFTVNNLMPVRLGEIARAILLRRWGGTPPVATLGTILVERLFDGLTLCVILALAGPWLPVGSWLRPAALLGGLAFGAATICATLGAYCPERLLRLAGWLSRPLSRPRRMRLLAICQSFFDGLQILRNSRVVVGGAALSVLAWLSEAAMYYLIMLGFGISAVPFAALLGMVAANLGTMIPSSPGFVGTFDWPLQSVLVGVFGLDGDLATSFTLVVHASLLAPVTLLGLLFLWREGLSLGQVGRSGLAGPAATPSTDSAAPAL
jgi:uncharacterized protein (TIRG00374 family)